MLPLPHLLTFSRAGSLQKWDSLGQLDQTGSFVISSGQRTDSVARVSKVLPLGAFFIAKLSLQLPLAE